MNTALKTVSAINPERGGLVLHYDFAGSGQSIRDLSGNNNTAQLGSTSGVDANDPTWTTGGRGITLGTGKWAQLPHLPALSAYKALTVGIVIRPTAFGMYDTLLAQGTTGGDYSLFLAFGTTYGSPVGLSVQPGGTPVTQADFPANLAAGGTYYLGVSFNGSTCEAFVRGGAYSTLTSLGVKPLAVTVRSNNVAARIGEFAGLYYQGSVLGLIIHDRALPSAGHARNASTLLAGVS